VKEKFPEGGGGEEISSLQKDESTLRYQDAPAQSHEKPVQSDDRT
jgi:hypothetical protein